VGVNVRVLYFAALREERGLAEEELSTSAGSPGELYEELRARHGFRLPPEAVRAAIDAEFRPMSHALSEGDTVAFLPPVAGG